MEIENISFVSKISSKMYISVIMVFINTEFTKSEFYKAKMFTWRFMVFDYRQY